MKLICGLGNPGETYEDHRHNVGFQVVDELCKRAFASLSQDKFDAHSGWGTLCSERVLFLEPQTFMNLSGRSLAAAARFYKIDPWDILVIHDELDLPFGRLQLKGGGGAGGHNGIKSILESFGEEGFGRLRFGVGKPEGVGAKEQVVSHVLSGFSRDERSEIPELLGKAADMAESWTRDGLAVAMNRFNRK